ncbi:MAG: hypothetical protein ACPG8K_03070, partial [Crocinitomicaceae bacterium]
MRPNVNHINSARSSLFSRVKVWTLLFKPTLSSFLIFFAFLSNSFAQTVVFSEDFEQYPLSTGVVGPGWNPVFNGFPPFIVNNNSNFDSNADGALVATASYAPSQFLEWSDPDGMSYWISPSINTANSPLVEVTFDAYESGNLESSDGVIYEYSIDNGATWIQAGSLMDDFGSNNVSFNVPSSPSVQLKIAGITNANNEKIGIDNIVVAAAGLGVALVCYDFTSGTGDFVNGAGGQAWSFGSTTTPSNSTGPQGSDASGGSGFYFTEASGNTNTLHRMEAEIDISGLAMPELNFDHHMYGSNMGTLSIEINGLTVWSQTGDQGNVWNNTSIDLSNFPGLIQVAIVGLTGGGFRSDMAVDNVCFRNKTTNAPVCFDFALNDTEGFTNGAGGGIPWSWASTSTTSAATGPQGADASGGSGFFYTESSSPNFPNVLFTMEGDFSISSLVNPYMTFDYHMYGSSMGTLRFKVNGTTVWSMSGDMGNQWNAAAIDLSGYSGTLTITIEGESGSSFTSDMAIDNFCIKDFTVPQSGFSEITTCTGNIMDPGGNGNYFNNNNGYTIIYPADPAGQVELTGTFDVETNYDYVYIYDGAGTGGPLLYTANGAGSLPLGIQSSGPGVPLTVQFTSDGSVVRPGFDFNISCIVPCTTPNTSYSLLGGGTICTGDPALNLTLSGSQTGVNYQLQRDGVNVGSPVIGTGGSISLGSFNTAGTYTVDASGIPGQGYCLGPFTLPSTTVITVSDSPTVSAGNDVTICSGGSTQLNGSVTGGANSLTTTFAGGNSSNGNMFDIQANQNITIKDFDVHFTGTNGSFEVYFKNGSYVGSETNAAAWLLVGTATGINGAGTGVGTPLNLNLNLPLVAGQTYAFYVTNSSGQTISYTNGTTAGAVFASNSDLTVFEGVGKTYPFGSTFSPRNFNGTIQYEYNPTFSWSPSTGLSSTTSLTPTASPTSTTTYTLTATANGCSASDNVTVTVQPQPDLSYTLSGTSPICSTSSTSITLSGSQTNVSYQLIRNGVATNAPLPGTGSSISFGTHSLAGTYTVLVFGGTGYCNGPFTLASSFTLSVETPPTAPTSITGITSITCGQSTSLSVSGGSNGSGATYEWYADGCGSGPILGSGTSIDVSPINTTTYYVRRVGNTSCTDITNCASITVTVNPIASPTTSGATICSGS